MRTSTVAWAALPVLALLVTGCGKAEAPSEPREGARIAAAQRALAAGGQVCVTVQRGLSGAVEDAILWQSTPTWNDGARLTLSTGTSAAGGVRRSLLRFDLAAIPPGATVNAATLSVFQLYKNVEGTIAGHPATAAWNEATVTWGAFGDSFDPAPFGSFTAPGGGSTGWRSLDVTALAQAWVSGDTPNHGVVLIEDGASYTDLRSSESASADQRPKLEVCYEVPPPPPSTSLMIQVLDADGAPVPLAAVTTPAGALATDNAGRLLLEGLAPGRFVASVEATGFTPASAVAELSSGSHGALEVRLLPVGAPFELDAESGGVIEQGPVRVDIPPGAIVDQNGQPVWGPVTATVVPFDPTAVSLAALPGPLEGITAAGGAPVQLEPVFMAEVSLWRGPERLQLAPGASATLELELPDTLAEAYAAGDTIPAWWFDLEDGVWREEGAGVIQPSSQDPSRLSWVVEVNHFTWWNADNPWTTKNCLDVLVLGPDGVTPMENIPVGVRGRSYIGISTTRFTGPTGHVCVELMLGGTAEVFASAPSTPLVAAMVTGSGGAVDCSGNAEPGATCQPLTLTLPAPQVCAPGSSVTCAYAGPAGTDGVGLCTAAKNWCVDGGTAFSGCEGEVVPATEACAWSPFDEDCDGQVDEGCTCVASQVQDCYGGPIATLGVGICTAGRQTCLQDAGGSAYGACEDEVLPDVETCATPEDDDCDGSTDCCDLVEWVTLGSGLGDQYAWEVAVDGAGNVAVAGEILRATSLGGVSLTHAGGRDIFVAKLDPSGNVLWARRFGNGWNQSASDVAVDSNGDVIIAGWLGGTADFGGGTLTATAVTWDIFVAKLDGATGSHLWSRRFGGAGHEGANSVVVDGGGNPVVAGSFDGSLDFGAAGTLVPAAGRDGYVVKLDAASGSPIWAAQLDGVGDQIANDVAIDSVGDVFATGWYYDEVRLGAFGPLPGSDGGAMTDGFIARLDGATGAPDWLETFGAPGWDWGEEVACDGAGSVLTTGGTNNVLGIMKRASSDGGLVWEKAYGSGDRTPGTDITVDGLGNVWVTGELVGMIDFDPGRDGWVRSSAGGVDIVLLKLDPNGQMLLAKAFPGPHDDFGSGLAVSGAGDAWLVGYLQETVQFCGTPATSAALADIFVARLGL